MPTEGDLALIRGAAGRFGERARLVPLDSATQLLVVAEPPRPPGEPSALPRGVREVLRELSASHPGAEVRGVVGDRPVPAEALGAAVARLRRMESWAPGPGGDRVVSPRRCSLARLLDGVDAPRAAAFVDEQLAALALHDRRHGTSLVRVLELALDCPDRNTAAHAAFMHRNTFRRQLRKAVELIDADLDSPEERLALQLALKMRSRFAPARRRSCPPGPSADA